MKEFDSDKFYGRKLRRLFDEMEFIRSNKTIYDSLSKRELQVAALIKDAQPISKISYILNTSKHTINNQKQSLKRKLKAKTDAEIIKFALSFEINFNS